MRERIIRGLAPVRQRQLGQRIARGAALGLLVSALAGIGLGVRHGMTLVPVPPAEAWAILLAGPALGALIALARQLPWHAAAAAADASAGLKDRSATALEFLGRAQTTTLHELQIDDAARHLDQLEPGTVVPLRLPRPLPYALAALVVALALCAWTQGMRPVRASVTRPLPTVLEQAELIAEDLKQLDELARKENDKGLETLVEQLRKKVEEMKQPGVDVREAMAKISEMQAAIAAEQAQYNVALVDAQLSALGDAMTPAHALEALGKALVESKFDKAAEKLETMEPPDLDPKEAKAAQEKMKQVAKEMGEVGLGQLGAASSDMAEGLKGAKGRFQKGSRTLANLVEGHTIRRKIKEILDIELSKLSECKSNCNGDKTARIRMPQKTDSPSENWGAGISGNVFGAKTDLKANHEQKEITGNPGDGPSEVETTHSAEGRQLAARQYRERYQKYRKISEAVLDSEPIPLGQRETIRRYFELIRPANLDGDSAAADAATVERRRVPAGDLTIAPRCPTPVPIVVPTRVTAPRSTRRPGRRCGPRWPTFRGSWSGGTRRCRVSSWWVTGIHSRSASGWRSGGAVARTRPARAAWGKK